MLNLNDREWEPFLLTDIFTISPGKRLTKNNMNVGKRPFIGATEFNNGITNWVSNTNISLDSDVLGVNYNGSVVETFYHPYECIFSDDVKRFHLKNTQGNRFIYLFLKSIIVQQKVKYAYGYKFNEERMNKQIILLPVTLKGKPDWDFMEKYICERECSLLEEYKRFVLDKYVLPTAKINLPIEKADWREFIIGDYFNITLSKGDNQEKLLQKGKTPLISSGFNNNGVVSFVACGDGISEIISANTVTVDMFGKPFFQPANYYSVSHGRINILHSKISLHKYALLFVIACLEKQKEIYSYNRMANSSRLKNSVVLLPSAPNGEPNWDYMEQYVCKQEEQLLSEYINSRLQSVSIGEEKRREEKRREVNWKVFEMSEIFTIHSTSSSIDKIKLKEGVGNYPYITRTDTNNGINDWISSQPDYSIDDGNCITVGLDTQTAFYQSAPFYTGQNIQIFRNENLNGDNAQFLVPLIRNAMSMFSWGGNGATLTRLRRSKIMLPATEENSPDWNYMTEYGRKLKEQQICLYLNYLKSKTV